MLTTVRVSLFCNLFSLRTGSIKGLRGGGGGGEPKLQKASSWYGSYFIKSNFRSLRNAHVVGYLKKLFTRILSITSILLRMRN